MSLRPDYYSSKNRIYFSDDEKIKLPVFPKIRQQMKNILIFSFLLIGLLINPCFSFSKKVNKTINSIPIKRALVIGVSSYQDSLLPSLPGATSDAEQFAAFLRSRSGGLIPTDLIHLLTGEEATMAMFLASASWLEEESKPGDEVVVFFTGHARLLNVGEMDNPYIFFADSPKTPLGAGTIKLSNLCSSIQNICNRNSVSFQLYLNLQILPEEETGSETWRHWMYGFEQSFPEASVHWSAGNKKSKDKNGHMSLLQHFFSGALGQADIDSDHVIIPYEAKRYLKKKKRIVPKGEMFMMAYSSSNATVGKSDHGALKKEWNSDLFPPLVGREISHLEDSLLSSSSEKIQKWYNDFIITMKLGQLIEPKGHCSTDLYDSLITQPNLKPLFRQWQRKLGAALLDETQQALNAYLKTDTRELFRRWKYAEQYSNYPIYMERAIEMMGKRSFMYNILQTKLHYFYGLNARLDAQKKAGDSLLLIKALKMQRIALSSEPEASFVLNEIGVVHSLLGSDSSIQYFKLATEYSPTWGIPYLNLAIVYLENEEPLIALENSLISVRLNPRNVIALNNLSLAYVELDHLDKADEFLKKAIALDIKYNVSYYNLSCVKSLQGDTTSAIYWLRESIKLGFNDWQLIDTDEDLSALRETTQFDALRQAYNQKE